MRNVSESVSNSICDLSCDATSSLVGLAEGVSYKYSYETKVLSAQDPTADFVTSSFTVQADTKCSFTVQKDSSMMKFRLTNGQVTSACPISGTLNQENELKAIASLLQMPSNAAVNQALVMDAVGHCRVEYERDPNGAITRSKDFKECVYQPENDFDFFNPYDSLANNWFGRSVQKCTFDNDLRAIACFEEHRFDNTDLDLESDLHQQEVDNGVIAIWTRVNQKGPERRVTYAQPDPNRAVESLKVRSEQTEEHVNLSDVMRAACNKQRTDLPNDAPLKFIQLVGAFNTATAGDLDSLYKSLDGICVSVGDLNARRTYLDALIWCGTDSCVNVASDLMVGGSIEDEMLESWLFSFTLNPNPTAGMASMVAKAVKNTTGSRHQRGTLALGALVHRVCREDPKKCQSLAGISEALNVLEQPLVNQCSGDRKVLVNALKAIGNSGLIKNEDTIRSCLQRNDEIAAEAVNALRRAPCSDFRFSELTNLIGNINGDLEVRQNAYIRAWDCPSIELSHFAEAQLVREPSENFKNLMYSHAIFTETLTDKSASLLSGIVSLFDAADFSPQRSSLFDMEMDSNGIDVLKLNNPGSILPRSIAANLKSDSFGMRSGNVIGAKIRAQNIENGIISVFNPINETSFDNSNDEREVQRSLGLDQQPRLRMDLTIFDNDVFSLDLDDMTSLLDELAVDYKKAMEMNAIEKMKAFFGYSQEGILKYFNNDPVDYQKEFMFLHHRASYPSSIGKVITSEIQAATLLRLKAAGTLSGAGFNGKLSPQASVVVTTRVTMDDIDLSAKMTIAADFESSLGLSYNPLTGTMEVRINKPSEEINLFKVEKEIISPAAPRPSRLNMETFDFPLVGFAMRFLNSDNEFEADNLFQNSFYALQYAPEDNTPIVFRGQYDPSNGLLASVFAQSAQENSAEVYFNYRQSDSHLLISARMLQKEMALEGQLEAKRFKGRITQSNMFPSDMGDIAEMALEVSDKASDAQNAAGLYKPSMTIGINGDEYHMNHILQIHPDSMEYEVTVNAGQMGSYYVSNVMKKTYPQFEFGVFIGGKPDPDIKSIANYGVRVGLDQNTKVNQGGYSLDAVAMVGTTEYGLKNHVKITDKDVKITFETLELLYSLFEVDELVVDFSAKWSTKRGKVKYLMNIGALTIPNLVVVQKGKIQIESDERATKNQMGKLGFDGRQTHTKVDIDIAFRLGNDDGKRESFKAKVQTAFSKEMDKAVATLAINNLSFAPGFTLNTAARYVFTNAESNFGLLIKANDFEVKTQVGFKSNNNLKKLNGIFEIPTGKYGVESEWEIVDAKNIRILLIPSADGKTYPTQLLFKDLSGEKLNMVLDVSLTGMMPEAMRSSGQDDTYTVTVTLQEEPKASYRIKGEMAMHDFMKTDQRIVGYQAELALMAMEQQQGIQLKAGSKDSDLVRVTAIRAINANGEVFTVGGVLEDKQLQFVIDSNHVAKAGETWRRNMDVKMTQTGIFTEMPEGETTAHFAAAGKSSGFLSEFSLGAQSSKALEVTLDVDLDNARGNLLIKQAIMVDQGFDRIQLIGAWSEEKRIFSFLAKRNGNMKIIDAKIIVLDNGIKFLMTSTDNKMKDAIPRRLTTKVTVNSSPNYQLMFNHMHQMNGKDKTQGIVKLVMGTSNVAVDFNWDKNYIFTFKLNGAGALRLVQGELPSSSNQPINLVESDINLKANGKEFSNKFGISAKSETFTAKLLMKQTFDSTLSSQVAFQIQTSPEIKTFNLDKRANLKIKFANLLIRLQNDKKAFELVQGINAGSIQGMIPSDLINIQAGSDPSVAFHFRLNNKNFFDGVADKTSVTQIFATGEPFVTQTRVESGDEFSQMEMTFNNVKTKTNGEMTTDFIITWTSDMSDITVMKTLERIEAVGSAAFWADLSNGPKAKLNAKFEMKAPQTGESADIELTADIKNWDNFHLRAYADQYFNLFPLISIYAMDITGDMQDQQNPILTVTVTRDDSYTDEVETYDTVLSLKIGDMIQDTIPQSVIVNLKVPDFIFGAVPFNDNSVGYTLDVDSQAGELFVSLIPSGNPSGKIATNVRVGLVTSPTIVINIDFGYNYGGDEFILNQAITLHDNGLRIGEKGLQDIKISLIDIEDEISLKLIGESMQHAVFKFRMENQNRLFSLDSHLTSTERNDDVFKFKFSMVSAEDTASLNRQLFQELGENGDLNPLVVELFKVVKTCLDPFMIGAAQGMYRMSSGLGGSRKKYGGDFTLDMQLLNGEKVEFHIQNNFDTKRNRQDFSFSSVFNIDCAICNAPVSVNDFVIDWSAKNQEVRMKWALDLEDKFSFDSSFQVEANVNSFEITGEPLIELHIDDENWIRATGIEELEVKIDFDARNTTDKFVMKMNKLSVEVNRGQYEFRATNGLLEVSHQRQILLTTMIAHNIDALSELNILERSELSGDLQLTDIANWNFDATLKVKGASRRTESLRDLHTIMAKSNFRTVPDQSLVKTGDVTISAVSSLLPSIINIRVNELGLRELALFVMQGVADLQISVESAPFINIKLLQKISGNYATELTLSMPDVMQIQAVNKLEGNAFELTLKAKAPIISENADYRSQLISTWNGDGAKYNLDATYSHNIREISFFELVPTKMIVNGQLAKTFSSGSLEASVGQYGTTSLNYDLDFTDDEGRLKIDIPNVTRQSIVIKTDLADAGWSISSSVYNHIMESAGVIKCQMRKVKTACQVTVTNQYQPPNGETVSANVEATGSRDTSGNRNLIKTHLLANVVGHTVTLDQKIIIANDHGEVKVTWNMPTLEAGRYIRLGGKLKLPGRDNTATGKIDFQVDDMEPFSVEVNTVINDKEMTVGTQAAIGSMMGLIDEQFGAGTVAKYWLPRHSIVFHLSGDCNVHKYKATFVPDRHTYDASFALERDGATIFINQPNEVSFFPTWASGHCELLNSGGETNFNCNGKGVIDGLTRELTLNSEVHFNFFEMGLSVRHNPTAKPIDITLRYNKGPAHVLFTKVSSNFLTFGTIEF